MERVRDDEGTSFAILESRMNGPVNKYRAVFVSDLHLGSAGSQVEAIQEFLRSFECDHLYLVGDIIDGWVGRPNGRWGHGTTELIRLLLDKTNEGCHVYYTPGNHDAFMRRLNGSELGNMVIDHSFVHELKDGRKLHVVHGDLFDRSCTKFMPVAWLGAWMYEIVTIVNYHVNRKRARRDRRPIHFASFMKLATKRVVKRGNSFENQLVEHAVEKGCDGVVCGHVHRPMVREREDGRIYVNTGDWVEHCTAVAETMDGRLRLIEWEPAEVVPQAVLSTDGGRRAPALSRR
jgi:UDP-2,3-diacylglucosamine pyrophosphatase LpxH